MEKVDMKELCPCQDKERYHELGSALEGCVHFNEDYKMLLLYIEKGRLAYGGYNPRPTCADVEDGILSKRKGNEDRDLDNRKQRIDMEIVPGKEQTMKDGILTKRRGNEDRGLDNRNHRIDVNIIPGMEQKIQNDSKFMDAEVKIEPQEDSDSLKEAESQSEVEILENVGAQVGWGSSSNPFVPSVEHCLNLDATIINSRYRKEVLNLLMTPYNGEEYKKLWKDIRMRLPSSSRNGRGKSLLSLHKAVNQEIKRAGPHKDKKLNIMRGFFFWLEKLVDYTKSMFCFNSLASNSARCIPALGGCRMSPDAAWISLEAVTFSHSRMSMCAIKTSDGRKPTTIMMSQSQIS